MPVPSLIDHFAALDDPRQSWKVLFPLPEILLLVLCGTLAGAENFVEIRGQMHQAFLRRLLPYKAGTPTIRREIRRRAGIEPVIGHMKDDGHLGRNTNAHGSVPMGPFTHPD